jgi:hypothetical protein
MRNPRHLAPLFTLAVAFGCASDPKRSETMEPASYEAPPDTTAEPKGLPPNAPPNEGPMSPDTPEGTETPEGAGTLQKVAPSAPFPAVGGRGGGRGGMGGTAGLGGMDPIGGTGGMRSIGDGRR